MNKVFLLSLFLFTTLLSAQEYSGIKINNPYASVTWSNTHYKANFHTHTKTNSPDGEIDLNTVTGTYLSKGYGILTITDHDKVTTWTAPSGMLRVQGNEVSKSHHIGSHFNSYSGTTTSEEDILKSIGTNGGLAILHHPTRHISSNAAKYTTSWYVDRFKQNTHLVGMEVFNAKGRWETPVCYYNAGVWDAVLAAILPVRSIWGFANDDMHRGESGTEPDLAKCWNVFPLPSLTESNLKQAMTSGAFYFCHARDGSGGGNEIPAITGISVAAPGVITITANNSNSISWIGSNGFEIATGPSIDCSTLDYDDPKYVRAVITGNGGQTCTQPFSLTPVEITSIQKLHNIRTTLDGNFILKNNLDFNSDASYDATIPSGFASVAAFKSAMISGSGWEPIGPVFKGTFDGNNLKISGLYINRSSENVVGLFRQLEYITGRIKNLNLEIAGSGSVKGNNEVGGVAGSNSGLIANCSVSGKIEGAYSVGGLVGSNGHDIVGNSTTGTVIGTNCVGALIGHSSGRVLTNKTNCSVTGTAEVGGIAGCNVGELVDNTASGSIHCDDAGGVAGHNEGSISRCYSTCIVDNGLRVGGLVGSAGSGASVISSYWDIQTSGRTTSAGGEGKTTAAMKQQSTYVGWDFTSTWISAGNDYPGIRAELFAGGEGTIASPYRIATMEQLLQLHNYTGEAYKNLNFILTNNIVLTADWTPVGTAEKKFMGHFSGSGFTVSGMNINTPSNNYVGMFGYIGPGSVVEDLTIDLGSNKTIQGNTFVGALAGWNDGSISRCVATGTGMIIGYNNCVGGIAGRLGYDGKIYDSYSTVMVKGNQFVGGLVGAVESGSFVTNAYSKSAVIKLYTWSSGLGGLIGANWGSSITGSYWDMQTSGRTTSAGGIGKTTTQMKQLSTYSGWDFSFVWNITPNISYPFLR